MSGKAKNKILMLHGKAPHQDIKTYVAIEANTEFRPWTVH